MVTTPTMFGVFFLYNLVTAAKKIRNRKGGGYANRFSFERYRTTINEANILFTHGAKILDVLHYDAASTNRANH